MTTTAFDDQFTVGTQTIEPVRQTYDKVAILKRNVADLELELKRQTELKERAEAGLAEMAQQKPVAWRHENGNIFLPWQKDLITTNAVFSPLYAAPVPVPAAPYGVDDEAANRIALAVYDCKNGINPEPLLYAINRILGEEVHPLSIEGRDALLQSAPQAPAVPASVWRDIVVEMMNWWDDQHTTLAQGRAIRDKARALLQSAEVKS